MAVDLKCRDLFSRKSVLLEVDRLVILEHGLLSDRVRRIGFDRVDQLAVSKQVPWPSVLMIALLIVLPGALLLLIATTLASGFGQSFTALFGGVLIVIGGGVLIWQCVCRQARIRITRAGETQELRTITAPRTLERFLDRLRRAIAEAQQPVVAEPQPAAADSRAALSE